MTTKLVPGKKAPAFRIPLAGGGEASLTAFKGRALVLFFYPKADTPGCTLEAQDFSKLAPAFERAGAEILGVSADPIEQQERFRDKRKIKVSLGSDASQKMLQDYGVWAEKSMYGRKFMGVVRTTVLIDADGKVVRVWDKVKVPGHAEEVLAAAKSM